MNLEQKELYVQPALVTHELLRDITASKSGNGQRKGHDHGHRHGYRGRHRW